MKKLFTLVLLALGLIVGTAQAQEKKTWDFTKGLSPETVANLNADTQNWTPNGQDASGVTNNWQNAVKPSAAEELKANGEVIAETAGLLFDIGNNKSNSIHIAQDRIRLTRANTTITFPQLKNGQTVTIVGRSANGSATDRGIAPVQDYLVLTDGVTTGGKCIFNGNQVEGSLGTYSFTWEVVTSSADPVDVQFKLTPNAGIDFTLFMIDNGDEAQAAKIAYLYDGAENDQVLGYLQANELYSVDAINVTTTAIEAEALRDYEVTIVGASVPADNAAVQVLKEALPWTPVLNLDADLYPAWGYGEVVSTLGVAIIKSPNNALFKDADLQENEGSYVLPLNDSYAAKGVTLGEYFAGDAILGVAMNEDTGEADNNVVTIHTHNVSHNGYIFLPYYSQQDLTENALTVLSNAISTLQNSKREITATTAPTIQKEYKHLQTLVTVKAPALPKAQVYYTIDGTDPTTASTPYEDVITLTQPCTLKAVAIAEGYTLSATASLDVLIKEQPKTPVIVAERGEGQSTIKLSTETEDATIWYNFVGAVDTLKSTKYADSIDVVITMPQTVTAFATVGEPGEAVFSEVATERVLVQNPRVVIDVAAHFRAPQWTAENNPAGLAVANGKGMFSWGASAVTMYTGEGTKGEDPETGDEIIIYTDADLREPEVVNEAGENPEWKLVSRGTCLIWQNTGAQTTNFGQDSNYNPIASTDVDELFPVTSYDIQFYKFQAGEPGNGSIETINKYQAPLDVVVLANMAGGPLAVQVSADGTTWQTIGEVAKTGYSRMWGKSLISYNGSDEVFVRVIDEAASAGVKVFDIYIANQGEKSQELLQQLNDELTGIEEVAVARKSFNAGIYSLNGVRLQQMQRGLNIVVGQDGQVRKVIVK